MSAVAIKGWCPGALRPMLSGDGLVVRIRPRGGRLDAAQAAGIAELAARHGNGLIDLTSRGNLQIRGVSEDGYPALIEGLAELGLLDTDSEIEAQRNILVTPFWTAADDTRPLAAELERALASASLDLPTKFGFAIDDGHERVLAGASADIRIERDRNRGLLVRADGAQLGLSVTRSEAVQIALALAEWFVASGGAKVRSDGWRLMWPEARALLSRFAAMRSLCPGRQSLCRASIRSGRWLALPSARCRTRCSPISLRARKRFA